MPLNMEFFAFDIFHNTIYGVQNASIEINRRGMRIASAK